MKVAWDYYSQLNGNMFNMFQTINQTSPGMSPWSNPAFSTADSAKNLSQVSGGSAPLLATTTAGHAATLPTCGRNIPWENGRGVNGFVVFFWEVRKVSKCLKENHKNRWTLL